MWREPLWQGRDGVCCRDQGDSTTSCCCFVITSIRSHGHSQVIRMAAGWRPMIESQGTPASGDQRGRAEKRQVGGCTVRKLLLALLGCATLAGGAPTQSNKPDFKVGDVVANPSFSGGCPTFEGLLQVLSAAAHGQPTRDIMTRNQCTRLDPRTSVVVIDVMMGNIMRVEPPGHPGEERLFVAENGFVRQRVTQRTSLAKSIDVEKGELYSKARERLVSGGYKPVTSQSTDEQRCGSRPEICRSYSEVASCSDTGRAYCTFTWSVPDGHQFNITTHGEELRHLTIDAVSR